MANYKLITLDDVGRITERGSYHYYAGARLRGEDLILLGLCRSYSVVKEEVGVVTKLNKLSDDVVVVCTGISLDNRALVYILHELEIDNKDVHHINAFTDEGTSTYTIPGLLAVADKVKSARTVLIITAVHQMGLPAPLSALLGSLGQFGLSDKTISYVALPGTLRHAMVPQVNLVPTILSMGGSIAKHNFVTTSLEFTRNGFSEMELGILKSMREVISHKELVK